jgi:predicted membrane protein
MPLGAKIRFVRLATSETTLNAPLLFWGLLFSSVGLGFFIYGRKQRAVVPLVCGLALMIFPYFISNTVLLVTIGVALLAIPYFVRI